MADSAVVQTEGLCKSYFEGPQETAVLADVHFTALAGEFLMIFGPSGSGKSTLLHLLGLMDRGTRGKIYLFGKDSDRLSENERASLRSREIGFVFQFDSLLPEFTVMENILMPALIATSQSGRLEPFRKKALENLESFGLTHIVERFPREISGGERQRVALIRALTNQPALILADEPTGNLDHANGERVLEDLRGLSRDKNVSVVMVTHNQQAVRYASRVVHLVDGKISERAGVER
ncbi:MAG: ABC transporter ATP-binding protein [Elusimicrobia bacterium]|nr:ABC transporter ATP-binding protein [Elusimicrobiota bacterium]